MNVTHTEATVIPGLGEQHGKSLIKCYESAQVGKAVPDWEKSGKVG